MEKKFVTYPVAKALKEVGFDEPCLAIFEPDERYNHKGENRLVMMGQPNDYEIYSTKSFYRNTDEDEGYLELLGNNEYLAPLWQDVIEWFMVKHNIYIQESCVFEDTGNRYYFKVTLDYGILKGCYVVSAPRLDLNEAREVAILAVIEMLIEKLKTQDSIVPIDVIVKKIPNDFLNNYVEKFNKGITISNVLVEYECDSEDYNNWNPPYPNRPLDEQRVYKLKVDSKDNTISVKVQEENM